MAVISECVVVPPFQSNCWILGCGETQEGVVIDPGEVDCIREVLEEYKLTLKYLIHTHGHLDHVSATAVLQREMGAPVLIHEAEGILLDNLSTQGMMFGLAAPESPTVDQHIREGDQISFGRFTLSVIETPGHSPGGLCLKLEGENILFAGDTLFRGSIGRTDLWGASYEQLMDSIRDKLWPLPDDTVVCPGHGPSTTIGTEKRENPFLQNL